MSDDSGTNFPDDPISVAVNNAAKLLRDGGGDEAPSIYLVMLVNDATRRGAVLLAVDSEERAANIAARIDKAMAGKELGFPARVEAISTTIPFPSRVLPGVH